MRRMGVYHLAKKSGNFGFRSNGKIIFRKFRSEIVEYPQRYSSFSVRNGTAEISSPIGKFSCFQSLKTIMRNRIANGKRHLVRLVCWFWKNPYHYSTVIPTGLFWQMGCFPFCSKIPKIPKIFGSGLNEKRFFGSLDWKIPRKSGTVQKVVPFSRLERLDWFLVFQLHWTSRKVMLCWKCLLTYNLSVVFW